jgi:hypothetical protein
MEIGQVVRLRAERALTMIVDNFVETEGLTDEQIRDKAFDVHSPLTTDGKIVHIVPKDPLKLKEDEFPIWVVWSNGIRNSYKRSWLKVM